MLDSWWAAALGTSLVASGTFFCLRRRARRWRPDAARRASLFELLPFEQLSFLYMPGEDLSSIKSVTFFEGEPPVAAIRERLAAFVRANPWAAARIVNTASGPRFWVPEEVTPSDLQPLLVELEDPRVRSDASMETLEEGFRALERRGLFCKEAYYCQDRDEPMLRVAVVRSGPGRFALAASMNHCIGDGHTYYSFYNALDIDPGGAKPIQSMTFQREPRAKAGAEQLMGKGKAQYVQSIVFFLGLGVTKALRRPHRRSVWAVDEQWLRTQKQELKGGQAFVSSNDVLTSWFLGGSAFCEVGLMPVNMRSRLEVLTDLHVGNYEEILLLQRGEYERPSCIRRAVQGPQLGDPHGKPPGLATSLRSHMSMVTNWSTFAKDVRLPGCKELLHLGTFGSDMFFGEAAVIFRARQGTLGLMMWERGGQTSRIPKSWSRLF